MKILLRLFWEMFKISSCVVGGGFAILAVADERFAKKLKWTEEGEMMAKLPIFQMVPGIIAGSTAVYIGRKKAGVAGAAAALAGVFLPSVIIFSCVAAGYAMIPVSNRYLAAAFLGLRAALAGIIFAMTAKAWTKSVQGWYGYLVMVIATAAIGPLKCNPAWVVLAAVALGVAWKFAEAGRGAKFVSAFWMLPLVFLKYGLIAFGGGYVLVPVYIGDFVGDGKLLALSEFGDVMALTQMTPGPIAVNCATFFGYRTGLAEYGSVTVGIIGAVIATFALLIPGSVLLYLLLGSIEKFKESRIIQGVLFGVKPITVALMLNAVWSFASMSMFSLDGGTFEFDAVGSALAVAVAVLMMMKKFGVVKLIVGSALISVFLAF